MRRPDKANLQSKVIPVLTKLLYERVSTKNEHPLSEGPLLSFSKNGISYTCDKITTSMFLYCEPKRYDYGYTMLNVKFKSIQSFCEALDIKSVEDFQKTGPDTMDKLYDAGIASHMVSVLGNLPFHQISIRKAGEQLIVTSDDINYFYVPEIYQLPESWHLLSQIFFQPNLVKEKEALPKCSFISRV